VWWLNRRASAEAATNARHRLLRLSAAQHVLFALVLATGAALLAAASPAELHARWLHLKVGLTLFLLLPLEAFHAYVSHVWIARALRDGSERLLERGVGLDDMVRSLAIPLLGAAVPLLFWLSLRHPL
jgi:uncharacterized membrane protein